MRALHTRSRRGGLRGGTLLFLVGLVAAWTALPPPANAADGSTPDLSSVRLNVEDLPPGFVVSETGTASLVGSFGSWAKALSGSTSAELVNGAVYQRNPSGSAIEIAFGFLISPLEPGQQAAFDRELAATDTTREQLSTMFSDAVVTPIEAGSIGERRLGARISSESLGLTLDIVIARRSSVVEVAAIAWRGMDAPSISAGGLSSILDARLIIVVGASAPAFRPAGPLVPGLTTHIPTPLDVSTDPAVIGANLVLAAIAALLLTISSKIATRMLAEHEPALTRRVRLLGAIDVGQRRLASALGARASAGRRADLLRLAGIALFYGLVFSLLDPGWEPLTLTGAWLFVSFVVACGLVGIADDIVQWRVARGWGVPADLAVRPTNVLLAATSTAVSRATAVVPGLMFGTPEALRLDEAALEPTRARRLSTIGFVSLIAIGGGAWVATIVTVAAGAGVATPGGALLGGLQALLLLVYAATVQNVFVALLGLSGSAGESLRRRSTVAWVTALGVVAFTFWHTLLNPSGDAAAALATRNVQVTLGLVLTFTIATAGVWAVLTLATARAPRPTGTAATAEGGSGPSEEALSLAPSAAPAGPTASSVIPTPVRAEPPPAMPGAMPGAIALVLDSADSSFRGRATLRVGAGWIGALTERIDDRAVRQVRTFVGLSAIGMLVPLLGYALTLEGRRVSDGFAAGVVAMLLGWTMCAIAGRLWVGRHRIVHSVTFPAALATVDVGRDWNIGCGIMILLTPLGGLLYLLLSHRRIVRLTAPLRSDRPGMATIRLKVQGDAEAHAVANALAGARRLA